MSTEIKQAEQELADIAAGPVPNRTVDEIRNDLARLEAELATAEGGPLEVWNGRDGDVADIPPGPGATLRVEWAVGDASYESWYQNAEAARAALLLLARANHRVPDAGGWNVDLTAPGCVESRAYVTRLGDEKKEISYQYWLDADGDGYVNGSGAMPNRTEDLLGEWIRSGASEIVVRTGETTYVRLTPFTAAS